MTTFNLSRVTFQNANGPTEIGIQMGETISIDASGRVFIDGVNTGAWAGGDLEIARYSHYHKDVSHLQTIDVYRVLSLFEVTHPAVQHAVKKLLVAGGRGTKDTTTDLQEAIDSLRRAIQMIEEDQ